MTFRRAAEDRRPFEGTGGLPKCAARPSPAGPRAQVLCGWPERAATTGQFSAATGCGRMARRGRRLREFACRRGGRLIATALGSGITVARAVLPFVRPGLDREYPQHRAVDITGLGV